MVPSLHHYGLTHKISDSPLQDREARWIAINVMPLSLARILRLALKSFLQRLPNSYTGDQKFGFRSLNVRPDLLGPLRDSAIYFMVGVLRDPLTEPDLAQETYSERRLSSLGEKVIQMPVFRCRPYLSKPDRL